MEHGLITATWIIAISTIVAASTAAIYSYKQNSSAKEQNKISKKRINFSAMLEIMKIFNDDKNSSRRNILYENYRNNALYSESGEFRTQDLAVITGSVRGTYDQIGKLVKDGYVSKEQFLSMYGGSVIRMYKVLRTHIETEQEKRESKHLAVYFEWLFQQARDYWKAEFPDEKEPEPF